ncbi:MAG: glycosyl hydrolase [Candidatus Entotheonellia bacterium]
MTTVPKGSSTPATGPVTLLIATRKGAWFLKGDSGRRSWAIEGPVFLGHIVHHLVLDPRDQGTLLMAARTGHLGPTVFRSTDDGKTWKEPSAPPAFAKAPEGQKGRVVDHVFWLAPGHPSEPDVWYAGTSPQGLFRSEDGGDTWQSVAGFNDHPMRPQWTGGEQDGTPDGPKLHSILIDPRDPNHMYLGMSGGGVFESVDKGNDWKPLNAGCRADFLPNPYPEYGHDPHRVLLHPREPDILYQQNHCGIYRMDRQEGAWVRIGEHMPQEVGDIGFPLVLHPRDPQTAWVFPMDGTEVWPRVSPGGKPAAYVTRDAGRTWQRLDRGLPSSQAWFTVLRQAMTADAHEPLGIYFGTTSGEVWASTNEGAAWSCIARHLPHIYAVVAAERAR